MTIANLNPVELIGYLAALLVFSTFYMKTMIPLRSVAIASNVAFITYGYLAGLYPVFCLHVVLLPLNIWRLYQMRKLLARVRQASRGEYSIESMMPFITKIDFKKADVIFRRGEAADKLYIPRSKNTAISASGPSIVSTARWSCWMGRSTRSPQTGEFRNAMTQPSPHLRRSRSTSPPPTTN